MNHNKMAHSKIAPSKIAPSKIAPSKRIAIIGGVAGGMSAAARARRLSESAEITVFEKGGYVSFANCGLPYYLGREIRDEQALVLQTPESLKARFNIDVRIHSEIIHIDTDSNTLAVRDLQSGMTSSYVYDELVLSVGAQPIKPPLPGIDSPGIFTLRSMEDLNRIEYWIAKQDPKTIVVGGAGFIGLEVAEQFVRRGLSVTLMDGLDQVLAPIDREMAQVVHQELVKNGVKLMLSSRVSEFKAPDQIHSGNEIPKSSWVFAGDNDPVPADMVIIGLGVRPDITLARQAGLAIGNLGGIRVDEHMRTSVHNVWALGDAIEVKNPVSKEWALIALGGPANRQGRIVADNIFGRPSKYDGSIGTAILRVFDLTVATTGLNKRQLESARVPHQAVHLHPVQHAGYFPGATRIDLKLLFHSKSGLLLGAQAIGQNGVDKRIDVLATALKSEMTVRDLADLELAYAPPFGSAKDPINLAGMAASNILDGLIAQAEWRDVDSKDSFILDVRNAQERSFGFVPNSVNIPLPELRKRISELPKNKTILVYCQSGQRSYFATRQLMQKGFSAKNLPGGYLTWTIMQAEKPRTKSGMANVPIR